MPVPPRKKEDRNGPELTGTLSWIRERYMFNML